MQSIRGNLTVGQIVAFTNYLLTTMTPLIMMTMLSNIWAGGIASAKRVNEVLDTVPDVRDAPDAICPARTGAGAAGLRKRLFPLQRRERRTRAGGDRPDRRAGADGGHPGRDRLGQVDAGEPRSALLRRDRRPDPARRHRHPPAPAGSLLARIGIVPQETVLFSGTVRDNIRYGAPGASDEEVVAAARAAQAHEFILALPEGYDTHVEERGANLSGGQKQRIAIARALLTRPEDPDPRRQHQRRGRGDRDQDPGGAGGAAATGARCFVVAQRISTVLKADKIVVLEKGRIVAEGTHAELIAASPIYREIYDSQLGQRHAIDAEAPAAAAREVLAMKMPTAGRASDRTRRFHDPRRRRACGRRSRTARDPRHALRRLLPYLRPFRRI